MFRFRSCIPPHADGTCRRHRPMRMGPSKRSARSRTLLWAVAGRPVFVAEPLSFDRTDGRRVWVCACMLACARAHARVFAAVCAAVRACAGACMGAPTYLDREPKVLVSLAILLEPLAEQRQVEPVHRRERVHADRTLCTTHVRWLVTRVAGRPRTSEPTVAHTYSVSAPPRHRRYRGAFMRSPIGVALRRHSAARNRLRAAELGPGVPEWPKYLTNYSRERVALNPSEAYRRAPAR
jgi:hypothetical protein